jgi:aromatic-L-amino-acid/L-tryptophan decarboxylase
MRSVPPEFSRHQVPVAGRECSSIPGARALSSTPFAEQKNAVSNDTHDVDELDVTLDPKDCDELRELGHRMVDDLFDDLRTLREQPVWRSVPDSTRRHLDVDLPLEPQGAAAAYDDFRRYVSPYPRGNNHPRFWGWVNGTALPLGILGDLLAAGMNPSVSSFENAANLVEEQVLRWLKQLLGFPTTFSSVLTSGSSMSNILALAVARNVKATCDLRADGVAASPRRLMLYCSTESHTSVRKAVELLGLGSASLRQIAVDSQFRIDITALNAAISADRQAGLQPICIIGNVGTVNTGAIDDLGELADICERDNLWLHVDGAFGALAWLPPEVRPSIGPLQRADSLAFDLHKWMYLPYDVGCVFIRDATAHRRTFATTSSYLAVTPVRHDAGVENFADYGMELSRRFRALKVWLCLKEHGARRFERQIAQNIRQARHLESRIRADPALQLMAPVPLNVVCFRFTSARLSPEAIDALNLDVVGRMQEEGVVFTSHTLVHGRVAIRVAITNHRTRGEDLDRLIDQVLGHGHELLRSHTNYFPASYDTPLA